MKAGTNMLAVCITSSYLEPPRQTLSGRMKHPSTCSGDHLQPQARRRSRHRTPSSR